MCDSGYYRLFGNCKICDSVALVMVLAIVVPAVAVLGTTVFIFWGGTHVLCTFRLTRPIPMPQGAVLQQRADFGI